MKSAKPKQQKKPLLKKWWFWVLAVFLGLSVLGAASGDKTDNPTSKTLPAHNDQEMRLASEAAPQNTSAVTQPPSSEPTPRPTANPEKDYVLNTSTMKIHRPTCSSVEDIKPENRAEVHGTLEDFEDQGYTACKRCNPS